MSLHDMSTCFIEMVSFLQFGGVGEGDYKGMFITPDGAPSRQKCLHVNDWAATCADSAVRTSHSSDGGRVNSRERYRILILYL